MSRWNRRLLLKPLEDRTVPTFYSVNALTDTGAGSGLTGDLRYCITQANANAGADFITFSIGGTINLTSELPITEQLSLNGAGPNSCTVDAKQLTRIFNIQTDQPVSIAAIKLTNALTFTGGGAIRMGKDNGSLSVNNCIISNNSGGLGSSGGGIFVSKGGHLTINQTTVSGNSGFRGAGIYFYLGGDLTMTNCSLTGNMQSGSTTGGGAIYFYGDVTNEFTIRGTTISGNTSAGRGGAIAINSAKGDFTITNSTITGNTSFSAGGGGIAATDAKSNILLESTIVAQNVHPASPDILAPGPVSAINCFIGVTNGISNLSQTASLLGNLETPANAKLAPLSNNGLQILTHLPLPGSPVRNAGSNAAALTLDQRGQPRDQEGQTDIGAVESVSDVPTGFVITMPTITSPGAAPNSVKVRYTDGDMINVSTIGVGDIQILDPVGKLLPITGVTLDTNTNGSPRIATYTFTPPGGAWDSGDSGTYSVKVLMDQVFDTVMPDAVPAGNAGIFQVSMANNYVVNAVNDEAIDTDGLLSLREAINRANVVGSTDNITFDANVFSTPQTITLALGDFPLVDAVNINGPTAALTIDAKTKSRHFSIDATGSDNLFNINRLTLINGKRTGFFPDDRGGAIRVNDETLTVFRCTLSSNTVESTGGAIYTESNKAVLTLQDSVVSKNAATGAQGLNSGSGAGIAVGQQDKVVIDRSWINGNSANGAGGGVYFYFGGQVAITNSTISGNTSNGTDTGGGGVFFYGSIIGTGFKITNSTISGNTAANGPGGGLCVYLYDGLVDIANSTIINNVSKAGGGITRSGGYAPPESFKLNSTVIAGNKLNNVAMTSIDISLPVPGNIAGDNNLIGAADLINFSLTGMKNQTGTTMVPLDAKLGPLMNNGGPTPTHAPLSFSPVFDAGNNAALLTFDQRGVPYSRIVGQGPEIGAFEIQTGAVAHVSSVVVNDGAVQRSRVTSITVTFDRYVGFVGNPEDAFTLKRQVTNASVVLSAAVNNSGSVTVVRLTFVGGAVDNISLIDGRFNLTIIADQFAGIPLDGNNNNFGQGSPFDDVVITGGTTGVKLFRIFGDFDGDGSVATNDFIQFRLALGGTGFIFDFNNDGAIAANDFIQFRLRFGGSV